jgi:hypothetical protein
LRRLYQLSPEEGRQLLVDEIRRPKPSVDAKLLRSLPDETLAEVDQVLLTNLETSVKDGSGDTDIISELIERYATAAILSRVRAIYEAPGVGKWACRPQAALLAYLLRVDPTTGGEHLNRALAARGKNFTRCYASLLTDVARLQMSAELEAAATAALDDSAQEVVSHAATVLGEYGSADTEKALWQRLEKWHDPTQSRSEGVSAQEATEKALRSGRAWLSDPKKLKQLRDLCLTERCDAEVERLITNWNYDITVALSPFDDSEYDITVAHYELKSFDSLKQKLLQFPKGTLFKWKKGDAREFQEIESYLEEHGMKLEREPEKTPQ